ncbi:MAG: ChaN family lipoprotein [Myxococcota bacterium]
MSSAEILPVARQRACASDTQQLATRSHAVLAVSDFAPDADIDVFSRKAQPGAPSRPGPQLPAPPTGRIGKPRPLSPKTQETLRILNAIDYPTLYTKVLDLKTGELIDKSTLMQRLGHAQVIYVSESHDNLAHHALQLDILRQLSARNPKTTLAMEFLYRSAQPTLDAYVRGDISEAELESKIRDGFGKYYPMYVELLRHAGTHGLDVVGLNVEASIRRKMVDKGWECLTPEEQKVIAKDIDLSNPAYRKYLEDALRDHMGPNPPPAELARMVRLQAIWDETFGEAIANHLRAASDSERQVMVVIGSGHVRYKFTAPLKSHTRYPASFKTLVPVEANAENPVDFGELLRSKVADYVYFSDFAPAAVR